MTKACSLTPRDTPVVTCSKRKPILGSLYEEIHIDMADSYVAGRLQGVLQSCVHSSTGKFLCAGKPSSRTQHCQGSQVVCCPPHLWPGQQPACSIPQALPEPRAALRGTTGPRLSGGGQALLADSAFSPASSLHGGS